MNELTNAEKIQVVMNTLETLDMKPTYDNVNKMLGILKTLAGIRDEISAEDAEVTGEDEQEG